ncbi:DUF881 domain-containing protein [Sporomusa sphaeroides]|jgi:uncharacterized protein YlxW (UPF0749 family)|uniref:DUF881 domain-containing protein n=1 Tax=Sporomusa sphaeroides TaxID=47679 RepID=UPI002CBE0D67|nr:DUF881 domain-containing protein [Sporomusa sphaeroides]HML35167.1 DUF881 domain-containing protein [Sporomusa sphaeroides]
MPHNVIINNRSDILLKHGQLSIAMVCVILGIMLAVQFRTTQDIRSSLQFQRAEDLTQRLMQVEKERNALESQVRDLRQNSGNDTATKDMENIKMGAGVVPLQGAGVIITVDDTKPAVPPGSKNPNLYLIKDEDILKILNELRAAGAEAISINNQRLIASSEIRTAGPFISINNMNFAAPFEIKAIGEPATLENALKMRGGVAETLQFWGIQVTIKQQDNVQIPAFKGTFRFNLAQPVQDGGK